MNPSPPNKSSWRRPWIDRSSRREDKVRRLGGRHLAESGLSRPENWRQRRRENVWHVPEVCENDCAGMDGTRISQRTLCSASVDCGTGQPRVEETGVGGG